MKALTICQPYAELIVRGEKRIENRSYPISHRGQFLIHAGKSRAWLDTWEAQLPDRMDFGFIIGIADLVAVVRAETIRENKVMMNDPRYRDHASGPWCWLLARVQRFVNPVPYRGAQGLFNVPDEIVSQSIKEIYQ